MTMHGLDTGQRRRATFIAPRRYRFSRRGTVMRLSSPDRLLPAEATIETIEDDHLVQEVLCRELEALADRLPDLPPLPELRRLSGRILQITTQHLPRAEALFTNLPASARPGPEALRALRTMHALDTIHGQDLVAALWAYAGSRARDQVGQLSYMLRCFFDGNRRAIALKESWIAGLRRDALMQAGR